MCVSHQAYIPWAKLGAVWIYPTTGYMPNGPQRVNPTDNEQCASLSVNIFCWPATMQGTCDENVPVQQHTPAIAIELDEDAQASKTDKEAAGTGAVTLPEQTRWRRLLAPIKGIGTSIRRHPHIAILPLMALGLMVGLGVWGVMAASTDSANTKKSDATASATDVATGFEVQCMHAGAKLPHIGPAK